MHGVTRYQPKLQKVLRMHSVTSTIENGLVYLPESAHWRAEYLHELVTFPKWRSCSAASRKLEKSFESVRKNRKAQAIFIQVK